MLQMWPNLNLSNFTGIQSITLLSSIRGMTERNPADSDDEQNINWLYININTVIKTMYICTWNWKSHSTMKNG